MDLRVVLILAAGSLPGGCRYDLDAVPPPGDGAPIGGGADAAPTGPSFLVTGLSPPMAGAGDTVVIEGRFDEAPGIFLPGAAGPVQPAVDPMGTRRLAITVPDGALSGAIELRVDGDSIPGPELRISSFAPRMGDLALIPRQFMAARQAATLGAARRGAAVVAVGGWLYVLGGVSGAATWRDDIERARIDADGTLGPFAAAGHLTGPRAYAAAIRIGDVLYLIGGRAAGYLDSIEQAPIDAGGLGDFAALPARLAGARAGHRAAVVGDTLYVLGGQDPSGVVATVEAAPLDA
ncbi:MAG TPA: hypothetical protein VL172_02585, partial [Kofleriaceae bacterium]|nr:hypothetical protein [Kofleriaceae bacterium]